MTFNFFRLVVLVTACWLALLPAGAHAAVIHFSGGAVAGCPLANGTYTCASLSQSDDITIGNGYTVVVGGNVGFTYFQTLKMSGSAALRAAGNLDLTGLQTANLHVSGGTLAAGGAFLLGAVDQTVTANVSAATVTTSGPSTRINGNVTATGAVTLGSSSTITGMLSAASVVAGASARVDGGIVAGGAVSLSSNATITGGIRGTTVTTGASSTITGNIDADAFTLGSSSMLTGDIKAPRVELSAAGTTVKGTITASTSLVIGSGNTVNGTVSGGTLTMASANVTINGNVTMTGDVDIGANGTINGDLAARNVTTKASGDYLNGNVAVNAIFLDYGARVAKTITCTGAGASGCSCVTRADANYQPVCGAPPPTGAHHFRITHNGSALTCQPQTVTVTACANTACTTPHYTGAVTATLQPGGKAFSFTGGETGAATVAQGSAGTALLSAAGAANASTCVNTADAARPCEMVFATTGLKVTATNHVSMAPATVTIQALTADAPKQSCVPLVANQQADVALACAYSNPSSGSAEVLVGAGTASRLACGAGGPGAAGTVRLTFDSVGAATAPLQYADVGQVALSARFSGSGANAGLTATGSGSFIAAPQRFVIEAVNTITKLSTKGAASRDAVFAKASETFTVSVSAVNAEGATTKNFGKEAAPENIVFTAAIANPADAGNNGTITVGQFAPIFEGASASRTDTAGLWSFDDVGTISMAAKLLNASGYYMGYAVPTFKTVGAQTIRFIPDHFDTVLMRNDEIDTDAGVPATQRGGRVMNCAGLGPSVRPCPAASAAADDALPPSFTHSGQDFFVKVLAFNGAKQPALTKNYQGSLAKPITLSPFSASGGAEPTPAAPSANSGTFGWGPGAGAATATKFIFSGGVGKLADPVNVLPRFTLSGAYPDVDLPPTTIYLRAVDLDKASSLRAPAVSSVEAAVTIVSGRLAMPNAYGAPNTSLPVEVRAQYYMPIGYVFNPQVNAVSQTIAPPAPAASFARFDRCEKGLAGYCPDKLKAAAAPATVVLQGGKGVFRVAPPSPAPTSSGSAEVSLGALFPYLPSATGRVTFGVYRSGPVIYRREVY
jgi:MSHA biogenesis protein MshQ